MVVTIPTRDIGGEIGRGLGQAGAGLAENLLIQRGVEQAIEDIRRSPDRDQASLLQHVNRNLGFSPQARQVAQRLMPQIIAGVQQMPAPQAPAPAAAPQEPAAPVQAGAAPPPTTAGAPTPQVSPRAVLLPDGTVRTTTAPAIAEATTGAVQQTTGPTQAVPGQEAVRTGIDVPAFQLLNVPSIVDTSDREGLRRKFSARPAPDPTKFANRAAQLLQMGRAANLQEANEIVRGEVDLELAEWDQSKQQFDAEELLITESMREFQERSPEFFENRSPEQLRLNRLIVENLASQKDAQGRPVFSGRGAAEEAAKQITKIDRALNSILQIEPLTFGQAAFAKAKRDKIQRIQPIMRTARRFGIQDQLSDMIVANDILSQADARALAHPPTEDVVIGTLQIPDLSPIRREAARPLLTIGEARERRADIDRLSAQGIEQAAQQLARMPGDQSLVVFRRLLDDRGYDQEQFNQIVDRATELGYQPSPLHEREDQMLARPVRYSLADYWNGVAPNFRQFIRNYVLGEQN
jgi:hypothetical protein